MTPERRAMREPVVTTLALLALLGTSVLLATTRAVPGAGYIEMGIAAVMVVVVLWFSMEVRREPPLLRLFSVIGFFWVAIMFGLTMLDYLSR